MGQRGGGGQRGGPQGLVVVDVWQMTQDRLDTDLIYQKIFDTPSASGEVTITGAQGERLILHVDGRHHLLFRRAHAAVRAVAGRHRHAAAGATAARYRRWRRPRRPVSQQGGFQIP